MKKNGFIASTLLYTFFIIFCSVLIAYIALSVHNNNLLNKVESDTQIDLKKKTLEEIDYGSYVRFIPNNSNINTENLKWIYIYKKSDDVIELVSDTIVIQKGPSLNLDTALNLISDNCFHNISPRVLNYNDFYVHVGNNIASNVLKYNIAKNTEPFIIYFLQNGTYKKYQWQSNYTTNDIDDIYDDQKNLSSVNINTETVNLRLVISLYSKMEISGGRGTYNNPYSVSKINC